jgi:hypothetical protein
MTSVTNFATDNSSVSVSNSIGSLFSKYWECFSNKLNYQFIQNQNHNNDKIVTEVYQILSKFSEFMTIEIKFFVLENAISHFIHECSFNQNHNHVTSIHVEGSKLWSK